MSGRKVVVLDGCGLHDQDLAPVLNELLEVLRRNGFQIETFRLHELKIAHCLVPTCIKSSNVAWVPMDAPPPWSIRTARLLAGTP